MEKIKQTKTHITIELTLDEFKRIGYILFEFEQSLGPESKAWNKEKWVIKNFNEKLYGTLIKL